MSNEEKQKEEGNGIEYSAEEDFLNTNKPDTPSPYLWRTRIMGELAAIERSTTTTPAHTISKANNNNAIRSDFCRDFDKIIFSEEFRRLADKTQVFPLRQNDHIHSRMTHSLEVSCVGRTLGRSIANKMCEKEPSLQTELGDVVAAACLAHDIGNPPFGHQGEYAMRDWWINFRTKHPKEIGSITRVEEQDFELFEGNANGFHILSQLGCTHAVIGAYTKYPCTAGEIKEKKVEYKKNGIYQIDSSLGDKIKKISDPKGGASGTRSLASYIVEAADDICNGIMDVEDAVSIKLIDGEKVRKIFLDYLLPTTEDVVNPTTEDVVNPTMVDAIRKLPLCKLRAKVIQKAINEITNIYRFQTKESLVSGTKFEKCVLDLLKSTLREEVYQNPSVVKIELAGFNALKYLMDTFVLAVLQEKKGMDKEAQKPKPDGTEKPELDEVEKPKPDETKEPKPVEIDEAEKSKKVEANNDEDTNTVEKRKKREEKEEKRKTKKEKKEQKRRKKEHPKDFYKHVLNIIPKSKRPSPDDSTYKVIMKIALYVMGMTDSFAINLCNQLRAHHKPLQ